MPDRPLSSQPWQGETIMRGAGILALAAGLLLLSGCGGGEATHESIVKDSIALLADQADIVATITDEASAEAARPELEALAERMKKLSQQATQLGEPPARIKLELEEAFRERVREPLARLQAELGRLEALKDDKIETLLRETLVKKAPEEAKKELGLPPAPASSEE